MNQLGRGSPPAAAVARHRHRIAFGEAPGAQFAVDGRAPLPLFEMDGPESVANPFIQVGQDARRVRQAEVLLPAQ